MTRSGIIHDLHMRVARQWYACSLRRVLTSVGVAVLVLLGLVVLYYTSSFKRDGLSTVAGLLRDCTPSSSSSSAVTAPSSSTVGGGSFKEIPLPFTVIPESSQAERLAAVNPPHGGVLVDLMVPDAHRAQLESEVASGDVAFSLTLTPRQACDLELLLTGAFSPLRGFMDAATYQSVVHDMRLPASAGGVSPTSSHPEGLLIWPMPITLDVSESFAGSVREALKVYESQEGKATQQQSSPPRIALRDDYHNLIAVLTVSDVYRPDKTEEARNVLGTSDKSHPAVGYLFDNAGDMYIGGSLQGLGLPRHYDFAQIRFTPAEVRALIAERGWPRTVAFQTRNPMHRAHIELTKLAAVDGAAGVLIHPVVGMTKPGDVEASVRVRCYQAMIASNRHYAKGGVILSLLPLAMRMAGPREALWHALIRKNHGASHFIVGRDHAGCKDSANKDFYGSYDAQELVAAHASEIGIEVLKYSEVEYVPRLGVYLASGKIPEGEKTLSISGTKFRAMMNKGDPIPAWFSDPDVIGILRQLMPPLHQRGFALFFTGLSGGGKTTMAHALIARLSGLVPVRRITFLDGDVVRTHLSKGLGFSIADRNSNVARIGWVAAEAVRHGGIVLASAIAPFAESRRSFRSLVSAASGGGGFFQIFVASSLGVCAARDVKGLYELAANGRTDLTGVSHPYELPDDETDLLIDTEKLSVDEAVSAIVAMLGKAGYLDISYVPPPGAVVDAAAAPPSPTSIFPDLSPFEKSLLGALGALQGPAVEGPGITQQVKDVAGALATVAFSSGKTDVSSGSSSVRKSGATAAEDVAVAGSLRMCTETWDRMVVDKVIDGVETQVVLFGGLPMSTSLAASAVTPYLPRDTTTGGLLARPDNLVLGVAYGASSTLLRGVLHAALLHAGGDAAATLASSSSSQKRGSALSHALLPQRLAASIEIGLKAASNEQSVKEILARYAPEEEEEGGEASYPTALYLTVEEILSSAGSTKASKAAAAAAEIGLVVSASSSSPATSLLSLPPTPEAARVYVAFDLWSHMRWQRSVLKSRASTSPPPPLSRDASRLSIAFTSPGLLPFAPHILRLDPCASVVAIVPAALLRSPEAVAEGGGADLSSEVSSFASLLAAASPAATGSKPKSGAGAKAAAASGVGGEGGGVATAEVLKSQLMDSFIGLKNLAKAFPSRVKLLGLSSQDLSVALSVVGPSSASPDAPYKGGSTVAQELMASAETARVFSDLVGQIGGGGASQSA